MSDLRTITRDQLAKITNNDHKAIRAFEALFKLSIQIPGTAITAGGVVFSNGTAFIGDASNFFWDDTNNRLGIGTNTPSQALDLSSGNLTTSGTITGVNVTSGVDPGHTHTTTAITNSVITTTSASYTVLSTDSTVLGDCSSNTITVSLPAATSGGRILEISKIDSTTNDLTIDPNGSELINGETTFVLRKTDESVTIQDTGSGWRII